MHFALKTSYLKDRQIIFSKESETDDRNKKNMRKQTQIKSEGTVLVPWLDASLSSHCSCQQQLGLESSRGLRTSSESHLRMTVFKSEREIYSFFFFFEILYVCVLKSYLDYSSKSSEKIHMRTKSTTAMAIRT